jgi:hypothetical protein
MYQCRDAAGKVAFQDRPCATGLEATRLRASESPPAAPAPAAVPLEPPPGPPPAPTRVPAGQRHVVVPAASDDPVWRGAFEQARRRRGVEVGAVGATLLRVFLEDARVGEDVQAVGTKLDDPADGGGGRYREIGSGGFVLVEHIARAGSQGHDQIELGALAHGVTRLPLTIPAPGSVAVLGDVVLARVRPEHAGHLEIHVESGKPRVRVVVGPLVVGGPFGQVVDCDAAGLCALGPIAPGPLKLVLPDFDPRRSRFETVVAPRGTTRLRLAERGPREVLRVEDHRP